MKTDVSIVLSVHNGEHVLTRALQSIADQDFSNYEIICINDASTDKTQNILTTWKKDFAPNTLTVIDNAKQLGLTKSLNIGIERARGTYIARIDADDWWEPTKLSKQVQFLQENAAHGVVGCWYINHYTRSQEPIDLPVDHESITKTMYRRNPFGHSCVLIRKNALSAIGGYNEELRYSQDRDLWYRLSEKTRLANLPDYLCHRNASSHQSTTKKRQQIRTSIRITSTYIRKHNKPVWYYLYLLEPLTMLLIPQWVRSIR